MSEQGSTASNIFLGFLLGGLGGLAALGLLAVIAAIVGPKDKPHILTVYSDGQPIHVYETTDRPTSWDARWHFTDRKSGKLVEVTGTVISEEIKGDTK